MPRADCLTYSKPGFRTKDVVTDEIQEVTKRLTNYRTEQEDTLHLIHAYNDVEIRFSNVPNFLKGLGPVTEDMEEVIDSVCGYAATDISRRNEAIRTRLDNAKTKIRQYEQTLSRLNSELFMIRDNEGMITLNRKLLDKELSKFPGYKRDSLQLGTRDIPVMKGQLRHTYTYCRFVLTGLKLTPSENKKSFINKGGPVRVPLPDIEVIVDLNKCKTHVNYGPHAKRVEQGFYSGAMVPHPHVMPHHDPCYGDFTGGIADALTNGDIPLFFLQIKAFFEQANVADPAGGFWHRLLFPYLPATVTLKNNGTELWYTTPEGTSKRIEVTVDDHGNVTWELYGHTLPSWVNNVGIPEYMEVA